MPIQKIISKIKEAEQKNQKIAMFHLQSLIHAEELQGVDPVQFCKDVGMKESFATEFRKMMSLSKVLKDEGYALMKKS